MKKGLLFSALIASSLLSGCANIFSDDVHTINVMTSNGKNADITVDGAQYSVPGAVILSKDGKTKLLNSETEGCAKLTALNRKIEPVFFANILGGYFASTSSVVDYATSSMWKYDDTVVIQCNN